MHIVNMYTMYSKFTNLLSIKYYRNYYYHCWCCCCYQYFYCYYYCYYCYCYYYYQ